MKSRLRPIAALACTLLILRPSLAAEPPRSISVSGQGKATAPPDLATIQTGVVTQAVSASEALTANSAAIEMIMNTLKEWKIEAKDIQTSTFDVQPEYKRGPRGEWQSEVVSYQVTNQVRVRMRSLSELGKVLDSLVRAGSNQISGISFGIDDPTGALEQARNRAIADARGRAQLYARAAGVRVGKVISISEQAMDVPRGQSFARAFAAEAAGSVPVATGEQEVQATVHMVFDLVDAQEGSGAGALPRP